MHTIISKGLRNRFLRFAGIGVLCLVLVQQPILLLLVGLGVSALVANAAGFMASAVVNYEAQRRFSFGGQVKGSWARGLAKFMAASLGSLCVNTVIFAALYYGVGGMFPEVVTRMGALTGGTINLWAWTASFVGAVGGTGFSFALSRVLIFGGRSTKQVEQVEVVPAPHTVKAAAKDNTLAWFMPAYNEGANLVQMVNELWAYLDSLGLLEFRIFIVNDGSRDNTGAIADQLAAHYAEVVAIHHAQNKGYGGALITGFKACVETGFNWWGFCDSDRQFAVESIGTLLEPLAAEDPDMVAGFRLGRRTADSGWRFWLGRAWHFYGHFILGRDGQGKRLLEVRDVDCGLKVGRVKSLALIVDSMHGQAASVSPELITRTKLADQTIVERGVTHRPRVAGVSTGDNPKVMLRSAVAVTKLGISFRLSRYFGWVRNAADDAMSSLSQEGN